MTSNRRPRIGVTDIHSDRSLYARAVARAGGDPVSLNPRIAPLPADPLADLAGLVLTGGPDVHPARYGQAIDPAAGVYLAEDRDAYEFPLIEAALARDLPVLAICRGMQVLNVALGGRLRQDLPGHRSGPDGASAIHDLTIVPGTALAEILDPARVTWTNSRHHQGFGRAEIAPGLEAAAWSAGEDLVEGVVLPGRRWVLGVQCHPERAEEIPAEFADLFEAFVAACRDGAPLAAPRPVATREC